MVRIRRNLCSASKKTPLKSVVKCYKMDIIHLIVSFFSRSLRSLEFWYTYVISVILSGESLEPIYFDFHVQRQIHLLALEIPTLVQIIVLNPIKILHSHTYTIPHVLNGILKPICGTFPSETGIIQIRLTQ